MNDPVRWTGQRPPTASGSRQAGGRQTAGGDGTSLADILERVLDKGIVIAGDVQVNLLDIELLTIKLRLVVASVDRAKEMGIDWWERDPTLSAGPDELVAENDRLRARIEELERLEVPSTAEELDGEAWDGPDADDGYDDSADDEPDYDDEPGDEDDIDDAPEVEPPARRPRRVRS